jgi:DNA polymerase-4
MLRRLQAANVPDIATLWNLQPKQAKAVWGSIEGERLWYAIHGFDLPERETKRSSIGHSHVLAAVMRTLPASRLVARRLLLKAATRLRRMNYAAAALVLHARFEGSAQNTMWGARRAWDSETGWADDTRFAPTQDTTVLLAELEKLWQGIERAHDGRRMKAVGVVLHTLCPVGVVMPDLFAAPQADGPAHGLNLFNAVDRINKKYGQDTVALGVLPGQVAKYVGAKIAFTRIPDMAEFDE